MKLWIKHALHITAFLLVLAAAVFLAGHYLMPHSNRYLSGYTAGGLLGEDFDTVDVLVMGDSNAAQGIAPMQWYTENGVTGYTYASGWLSVYNIYYRLRSIYEEQTPKVVVLCTDVCYSKFSDETYLQAAIGDITDELIPLVRFHDNWKDLTPANLFEEHDYTWRDPNKGYMPITDVAACLRGEYMYYDGRTEPLPFLVGVYMERIADLCAEHGSELLLITVPASSSWNLTRHDGVQAFADAHGLPYIDYNMPENDPGIDWLFDTPDGGSHLNVLGSEKLTAALGAYLVENYDLPDHRGEPGFEAWDADAASYAATMDTARAAAAQNAGVQRTALEESGQLPE